VSSYDFNYIEAKWQKKWDESKPFEAKDFSPKQKYYVLSEFFGPSGTGIHLGHVKCFTPTDIIARYMRLKGYNVLYPAGWDAFGLPTENYAIKTKTHPEVVTETNIRIFTNQLKKMGYSFDWSRTIGTSFPSYYHWTQWIFLQLFKHGLAYKAEGMVNFCPVCMTVLSNEDSQGGTCDRCNNKVIEEKRSVWYLKMKDYSEKILNGVEAIDMNESLKDSQRNWVGKSVGGEITFTVGTTDEKIRVFTTRPDTIFGATFLVLAPEHQLIEKLSSQISNYEDVVEYRRYAVKKTNIERAANKDKTGIKLENIYAVNPINAEKIPIFISDYVMAGYGTAAIMAVPGHDTRDYEFAKKFGLKILEVISGGDILTEAYVGNGKLINSDFLNGLDVEQAKNKILERLENDGTGEKMVNYKMQDWPFNRQRYWGEPFPIVFCEKCGCLALSEDELPLILPMTDDFTPDTTGNSPLAKLADWIDCKCPKCGGICKRETDTMPNWAGSSWYWLRFMDPHNENEFVSKENLDYWGEVDLYTGGVEHVTRHMLYASFWHNFLYDIGAVPKKIPFTRRMCNGLILDGEGKKMSKSSGNVVNPLEIIKQYGADTFRMHMMFIGEYEQNTLWTLDGISGIQRFLNSVWKLKDILRDDNFVSDEHSYDLHSLIKRYSTTLVDLQEGHNKYEDHNDFKFNTIISAMMTFVNRVRADGWITREEYRQFLIMLNPFAPHISSELYEEAFSKDILDDSFPDFDESKLIVSKYQLPIQVNGKMKGTLDVAVDISEDEALSVALAHLKINQNDVKRVIFKPKQILNVIIAKQS